MREAVASRECFNFKCLCQRLTEVSIRWSCPQIDSRPHWFTIRQQGNLFPCMVSPTIRRVNAVISRKETP